MATIITEDCINCGACEPECPNTAIYQGGVVIIEEIFSLPGLGRYALGAVRQEDYLVVQTFVVFSGFMFVMVILAVDILYAWLNPRIQYS